MATTTTTTQPVHTRSRFGIALMAFLAILRRDLVVTGREFIAFLVQVLLQPLLKYAPIRSKIELSTQS